MCPRGSSLLHGLIVQLRVIFALLIREIITRYGRHNIGFIWLFAEPMLFTLGVTTLFSIIGARKADGISIAAFVLTGYSTVLLWRNMPSRCVGAIRPNHALMFHRQVKPIDVYFSRLILEALGATISLIVLTIVFVSVGLVNPPEDYLTAAAGWFLLAWYAFALSAFIGALSEQTEFIERVYHVFNYLMVPLSGSFFIVESLPEDLRKIMLLNPTVNCAELFREGFFGKSHTWHYDIGYVLLFNTLLTFIGLLQIQCVSKNPLHSE
jgi:ABC-type polysaccharide/polyol phosphate export permease